MIVKNGENNIERCLKSVQSLVDEIVIVDTGSTDSTVDILKGYNNINLFYFQWCNDFSLARNFAIDKTNGDYVLVLDSDEYIIEGSRSELEQVAKRSLVGRIKIINNFIRDNEVFDSIAYVSRFFPRSVRFEGCIHEQLDTKIDRVEMNLTVKHDGYFETNKSKRNIPLLIQALNQKPTDPYYLFQLGKELRIDKQYEQAFKMLMKSYALSKPTQLFYNELILEIIHSGKEIGKEEVLNVINNNEEILKNVTDFHFAKGLFFLDFLLRYPSSKNVEIQMIESSFLSCLALGEKKHTEYVKGTSSFLATYNLGVYYEITGNFNKAIKFYKLSTLHGYLKAKKRLDIISATKSLKD